MSVYKTYRGSRLDLEHYKGKDIIDHEISVFNDDNTDYDLSIYDNIIFKLFEKQHGTELISIDLDDGVSLGSPVGNEIYFNVSADDMDLRPKYYYHECYGIIGSPEKQELIFHGVSEII